MVLILINQKRQIKANHPNRMVGFLELISFSLWEKTDSLSSYLT